ncbi:hypothetical protein ACFU53_39620 [Streptomyces sp. NPDC057474]|uniref:hypothetical protein n=1 Tax=Streptomyces sp. NPDC057474 TaxID=3346144 RepID=UPI00369C4B3C
MVRYVHHQLITVAEAAAAMAVTVPAVLVLRDLSKPSAGFWQVGVPLMAFLAVFGLLSCTVRRLGGEIRDYEAALPLADPDSVLPTPQDSLRRSFDVGFVGFTVVTCLVIALAWEPLVAYWPLVPVPDRVVRGAYAARWERRHGLLLWRGHVADQPLGAKQYLYSSVRQPAAR